MHPEWDGVWTRQNHFARRLAARGAHVLYVETPGAWSSRLRRDGWRGLAPTRSRVREVEPRLHVMSLPTQIPGTMRLDAVADLNGRIAHRAVRSWLDAHQWTDYWCGAAYPRACFVSSACEPSSVVYDVTDDYSLYVSRWTATRRVEAREQRLASQADTVFVTSEELSDKPTLRSASPVHVPNGVEYDLFAQAAEPGPCARSGIGRRA